MKNLLKTLPEFYFIVLGVFWITGDYFSGGQINYIALLITWLIFLQTFYKNKVLGLIYGNSLALVSVYMLLALLSEYKEFYADSLQSMRMLVGGLGLFGIGLVMAVLMIYNYAPARSKLDENELTITY